jgi:transposase
MKFYCGIDLSARDCHVCVIDQELKVIVQEKLRNELPKVVKLLVPYKTRVKIVVESTFNWYWLIDGLQAEGFEVVLAHTLGLYLITGAKVKTDRRDAYALAKLLLVGAMPAAYIYPVETRPVLRSHYRTTWSVMLHGEPAWLFGAVHSLTVGLKQTRVR